MIRTIRSIALCLLAIASIAVSAQDIRLNPLRPIDGIYFAPGTGTALNLTHYRQNEFFGIINEYASDGSGVARWYTFTISFTYNDVGDLGDQFIGTNQTQRDNYLTLRSNPSSASNHVMAHGSTNLIETVRINNVADSHLTDIQITMEYVSTSVVDVTYNGHTERMRMLYAVPGFTEALDGPFRYGSGPFANYRTPASCVPPFCTNELEVKDRFPATGGTDIDMLQLDSQNESYMYRMDYPGYVETAPSPNPVPTDSPIYGFLQHFNDPNDVPELADYKAAPIVYWNGELDIGFVYLMAIPFNKTEYVDAAENPYMGVLVRTSDGFRFVGLDYDMRDIDPQKTYHVMDFIRP